MDWWRVLPLGGVVAVLVLALVLVKVALRGDQRRFSRTIALTVVWLLGALGIVLELPIEPQLRGQLVSLLGVLLSASIALGSTVLVSHGLSGVALKVEKAFRTGDFIEVGGYAGRVTHRGVLHTEVQTETRDLLRLPNHFVATTPVRVVQKSGTIVTATVGLGYDAPVAEVEELLVEAATEAGLEEPFVLVDELRDFTVAFRCGGLLRDTKQLISAPSLLRRRMLGKLHGAGIEVASPNLMSTRAFETSHKFMWSPPAHPEPDRAGSSPESLAFDKAERAESVERLAEVAEHAAARLEELRKEHGGAEGEARERLAARIAEAERRLDRLRARVEARREQE